MTVDPVAQYCDRSPDPLVVFRERPAAGMPATRRSTSRIDPAQRGDERGQIGGGLDQIANCAVGADGGRDRRRAAGV